MAGVIISPQSVLLLYRVGWLHPLLDLFLLNVTAKPDEDCHLIVSANHNVLNMNFIKVIGNAHMNNIPTVHVLVICRVL